MVRSGRVPEKSGAGLRVLPVYQSPKMQLSLQLGNVEMHAKDLCPGKLAQVPGSEDFIED